MAIGLPYYGFGCMLTWAGHTPDRVAPTWNYFSKEFCVPRTMLTFSGNFTDLLSCVGNYKTNAAQWAAHPDLNGTNTGKRCIPVIGFPSATLSGDMTFASIAAGSNDVLIARLITVWAEKGFKTLIVRWGYEDNYPTTPGGVDAYPGSNFEKTYNGRPTMTPWKVYGGDVSAYCAASIKAFRRASHVMHAAATQAGVTLHVAWGPTLISSCHFDPRLMYPDNDRSDGYGKTVDLHQPDIYANNVYGKATLSLFSGYQNQAAFTPYRGTPVAVPGYSRSNPTNNGWGDDIGSRYYYLDWLGGYVAPPSVPTKPLAWSGGWGTYESMVFALQQGCSWGVAEFGGMSVWNGSHTGTSNGPGLNQTDGATNYPWLGHWCRTRTAWFNQKSQNGIADGTVLQYSFWENQGNGTLNGFRTAFPEFVRNPDAGRERS
jgi:hypothetical protein